MLDLLDLVEKLAPLTCPLRDPLALAIVTGLFNPVKQSLLCSQGWDLFLGGNLRTDLLKTMDHGKIYDVVYFSRLESSLWLKPMVCVYELDSCDTCRTGKTSYEAARLNIQSCPFKRSRNGMAEYLVHKALGILQA